MFKLIGLIFLFYSCNPKENIELRTCDEYNTLSNECIIKFYKDNNYAHLDTALMYIDTAILNCNNHKKLFSLRKLSVYSIMQEYDKALMFIDSIDDNFIKDLPYFKKLLKFRFLAMHSELNNDFARRDSCLNIILYDIDLLLNQNKTQVDSLLVLADVNLILSNSLSTSVTQYYYYKSIIFGIEPIVLEITEKREKIRGNEDFFDYLKICLEEDFMIFIGI
jgi:hypothetical protein